MYIIRISLLYQYNIIYTSKSTHWNIGIHQQPKLDEPNVRTTSFNKIYILLSYKFNYPITPRIFHYISNHAYPNNPQHPQINIQSLNLIITSIIIKLWPILKWRIFAPKEPYLSQPHKNCLIKHCINKPYIHCLCVFPKMPSWRERLLWAF